METVEYKHPSEFTELGWKRFLTRVRKEIASYCYRYREIKDYVNERREEGIVIDNIRATKVFYKHENMTSYWISVKLNGYTYVIEDDENAKRAVELYYIVSGGGSNHDN